MSLRPTRDRALPLAAALATLVACADAPSAPILPAPTTPVLAAAAAPAGRYVVRAPGGFGADFADRVAALGGTVESLHSGAGLAVVSGLADSGARALASSAGVVDVVPDVVLRLDAPVTAARAAAPSLSTGFGASVANPTTAILYPWQWNMRVIHADAAWAAGHLGDPGVTVAILDSGMDYDNLDLAGRVDLSRSTSFVATDDALRATYFPSRHVLTDLNGHGTNVATQVASNAVVFAGVGSRTTLIGVKVLGQDNAGTFGGFVQGILWAADHGADVANLSLGNVFAHREAPRLFAGLSQVIGYAATKGMLTVVAAMNDEADLDHDRDTFWAFCDVPHVVCVSAVGPARGSEIGTPAQDTPSYFTNYGRSAISVAAPGGNADAANGYPVSLWPWGPDIASWVWSLCSRTVLVFPAPNAPPDAPCITGNVIIRMIGTSQAAPHVSGLAALLVAKYGRGQPQRIRQLLTGTADDLGPRGVDPYYGRGRIDVKRALGL
jgi:lantibiotic leader peptide-processing serine protease